MPRRRSGHSSSTGKRCSSFCRLVLLSKCIAALLAMVTLTEPELERELHPFPVETSSCWPSPSPRDRQLRASHTQTHMNLSIHLFRLVQHSALTRPRRRTRGSPGASPPWPQSPGRAAATSASWSCLKWSGACVRVHVRVRRGKGWCWISRSWEGGSRRSTPVLIVMICLLLLSDLTGLGEANPINPGPTATAMPSKSIVSASAWPIRTARRRRPSHIPPAPCQHIPARASRGVALRALAT